MQKQKKFEFNQMNPITRPAFASVSGKHARGTRLSSSSRSFNASCHRYSKSLFLVQSDVKLIGFIFCFLFHPMRPHVLHGSICILSFNLSPICYILLKKQMQSKASSLRSTLYPTALIYLTTPAWERRIKS